MLYGLIHRGLRASLPLAEVEEICVVYLMIVGIRSLVDLSSGKNLLIYLKVSMRILKSLLEWF